MGTLGKAIYTAGFWIRETGQAIDRLGCRLQGNYYFQEQLSRHRTLMNVFDKAPAVDKDAFVAPSASVIGGVQVGRASSIWYGRVLRDCRPPFATGIGSIRTFSDDVTHLPNITPNISDPDIENVFKDIMAASWDELPDPVKKDVQKALSKDTNDKAGQEALLNVFRAAEACEEFGGILVQLRMSIDDSLGMSGENVKPLPDEMAKALDEVHKRYKAYLDAFGPEETYLRKKVETELGTKMIHLKMRCSGLPSDWAKVTVLGTSGLSGSYVEQRAP